MDQSSYLSETGYTARPSTIFSDACETNYHQNWLGTHGCTTCYILFDMQVTHMITTVVLKPTTQNGYYGWGTLNFDIHVGNSVTAMTLATQGTMMNVESPNILHIYLNLKYE